MLPADTVLQVCPLVRVDTRMLNTEDTTPCPGILSVQFFNLLV
jgi:hypothetical protein